MYWGLHKSGILFVIIIIIIIIINIFAASNHFSVNTPIFNALSTRTHMSSQPYVTHITYLHLPLCTQLAIFTKMYIHCHFTIL